MESINRLARVCVTLFSGVAFGMLGMTGVFAAVLFPAMKRLDPSLPGWSEYTGPHWSLAAGIVAERVFDISFLGAGVAIALATGSIAALAFTRGHRRLPIGRLAILVVTLGFFLTLITWVQPAMARASEQYRNAAAAGENPVAAEAKDRFDALHPVASKLIGATTIASLVLFVASAWAAGKPEGAAPLSCPAEDAD